MKKSCLILLLVIPFFLNQLIAQVHSDSAFNTQLRKYNGGWIAGDATFSIALPDHRTLWLFGDSFIGTVNPDSSIVAGSHFIRNCAVLQEGDSMRSIYSGTFSNPDDFLPSANSDSVWYWPEHGLVENDTLKIFFSEFIKTSGTSGWNFKYTALYLAFFSYPGLQYLDKMQLPYYSANKVCYGNCILNEDGYTYIYGRKEADTIYHVPYPHVARAPSGNLQAPWQFFNGTDWVSNPLETHKIGNVAVSQQYGFYRQNDTYVLITQDIWLSPKIYSFTSTTAHGPLNNKTLLYTAPILYPTSFTYNAFPHTQFTENDELLISYNTNGDFWQIFNNVELYRPMFIRVPLNLIDPSYVSVKEFPQKKNNSGNVIVYQNCPNPADNTTNIKYTVTRKCFVSLQLCDMDGREIQSFVNKILDPGTYVETIDLRSIKAGIYSYRINDNCFKLIKN